MEELKRIENPDNETLFRVGLTRDEFSRLVGMLGRYPNLVEMGMVGALWSEHCGYKSSKAHLKKLPTEGDRVLQGPGENAGVVRVNDDLAAVFKIESHNHPSAVEPFHGAATGVGGIIRDVFAMGARPLAILDPLRFGPITRYYDQKVDKKTVSRNRYLLSGVTAGIAFYGNCIGIPTVGGELVFHESYSLNPLMNGLCLGIVKPGEIIRASAKKPGSKLVLVGAKTGRDGIQGATFASVGLAEDVHLLRPAVQIGDPFLEKCLLEATLALRNHPALIGVQDLGAAGLTSSASEMASRGGVGVSINLENVPLRAKSLTPYETMLSESQERMLMVLDEEGIEDVYRQFRNWDLDATVIGEVIGERVVNVWLGETEVARLPVDVLVEGAPVLTREQSYRSPNSKTLPSHKILVSELSERKLPSQFPACLRCRNEYERALCQLMAHPNSLSRKIVWEHYDRQVQINTIADAETADASVLRLKGYKEGLSISTDGPGHLVAIDPFLGGVHAIKEAYLNVLCTGAEPIAYTNCLNFASPEIPEVMASFAGTVDGMVQASRALSTPVVSGNVSFYNETAGARVMPTPVIGMLGVLNDANRALKIAWTEGDTVFLLASGDFNLFGSGLLVDVLGNLGGWLKDVDFNLLLNIKQFVLEANALGLIESLHDVNSSGLLMALIECAIAGKGARIELPYELLANSDPFQILFGYPTIGVVGTCREENFQRVFGLAQRRSLPLMPIGRVGGGLFSLCVGNESSPLVNLDVQDIKSLYLEGLSFWLSNDY